MSLNTTIGTHTQFIGQFLGQFLGKAYAMGRDIGKR